MIKVLSTYTDQFEQKYIYESIVVRYKLYGDIFLIKALLCFSLRTNVIMHFIVTRPVHTYIQAICDGLY